MERIPVEPAVLRWARESAGLHDFNAAAKKLSVSPKSLGAWESGELDPTIKQLRNMSKVYKRPLAVLLLPLPPKDFDVLRDFRRAAGSSEATWSAPLEAEFRRAVSQRDVYLELAEVAPNYVPDSKQASRFRTSDDTEQVGNELRKLLGMDGWPSTLWSKPRELLNQVIVAVEDLGILVIHTRDVSIEEMRGFSVAEWPYPVIALNGSDAYRPRVFTLLHELVHLGLQSGGLCDLHETSRQRKQRTIDAIEQYCNQVAAAVLMPRSSLVGDPVVAQAPPSYRWSLAELQALSDRYGASSEAVLIRLIGLGKASWDLYVQRKVELDKIYAEFRRREKEQRKDKKTGPSYYTVKARDLGHRYIGSVLEAYHSRFISSLDVTDYLSVRYEQLPKLQEALRK